MNRQELIDAVASQAGTSKSAAEETIDAVPPPSRKKWPRTTRFS